MVIGSPDSDGDQSADLDWLTALWTEQLSDRQSAVLSLRADGRTLDEIGQVYGVTRERIRQIELDARKSVGAVFDAHRDELPVLEDLMAGQLVVSAEKLFRVLPSAPEAAQHELIRFMGLSHPQTWDGPLLDCWCYEPGEIDRRLNALADLAPMSHENMAAAMDELRIEMAEPVSGLLSSENSKIIRHELGWIRVNRTSRDLAYLWLEKEGSPRSASEIAAMTGNSERAIRETMRRDEDFAQVRPEGTWALADWRAPGAENRYKNAEEVLIDVLREMGPMELADLRAEVRHRYPVTAWRINQCLTNSAIGRRADGKYDLAERGAVPLEESEPRRPDHIKTSGDTIGVRMLVDSELLRGSGLHVNRWLTWHLGLRTQPSERVFQMLEPAGSVTIRRGSSNAQISSLRSAALAMDLVEGCEAVLLLNTVNKTARLHHACQAISCPAASAG
jgi:hypothetical protein